MVAVMLIAFLVYSSSLGAELDVRQDDHRILFFADHNQPQHEQLRTATDSTGKTIEPTLSWFLESDTSVGRFRPLTQALEVAMPQALGTDPFVLHLLVLLMALLTTVVLFYIGFKLGGSSLEGAALAVFVLLAPDPGPSKVWYFMSVKAELCGTLFVLFAILANIRAARSNSQARDEILPIVMIAVAMLFKEPFALLLPALLLIRLALSFQSGSAASWREIPRLKLVILGYLVLTVAYSIAIWMGLSASPKDSYGTQSLHDWSQFGSGLISIFRQLPMQAVWFTPLLFSACLLTKRVGIVKTTEKLVLPLLVTVMWVGPQVLLYAMRGGMWDHYWLPALLGIAGLNAWCLRLIRLDGSRTILAAALMVSCLWVANGIRTNYFAVQNYVQLTKMRDDAANALVTRVPRGGYVVIVADNKSFSEYAMSWVFFAANKGNPDTRYLLYDTSSPNSERFSRSPFFPHVPDLDSVPSCQVAAVVFLNQPSKVDEKWGKWYEEECFSEEAFPAQQRYFSLRKMNAINQSVQLNVAFHKPLR